MKKLLKKITMIEVMIVIAIIGVLFAAGKVIQYEIQHPCVRYIERTCTRSVCVEERGHPSHCVEWVTRDEACNVCVERKP